ncbi:protein transporter SEC13 [Histoplasma capsulatum]|uniref:Protein transport protein SEC13 n=1 Tax=Ajellomyces capsulatus TaxID=5037 RepID=A0A8A1MD73_AJECA|nr:protein transporter SEC13 [Histoplasma capsulatum]
MPLAPSNQGDAMDIMPSIDIYDTLGLKFCPVQPFYVTSKMAQVITNSGHDDMIHDAALDYYGRRLATCSSDKTIKIFEVEGDSHRLLETLKGKAHPKFGTILASSSYDGKVLIWREQAPSTASASTASTWTKVFDFSLHTASVNGISWAPHESGCLLACASSDGNVSVLEFSDNSWTHQLFHAHGMGVNSVSWAPSAAPGSIISTTPSPGQLRRFVTGGSDNLVKIWEYNILSKSYIASASQDKTVRIWTSDPSNPNEWTSQHLEFDCVLWRVSWSLSGNVLAISGGDNKVSLWKENLKGQWEKVKDIED